MKQQHLILLVGAGVLVYLLRDRFREGEVIPNGEQNGEIHPEPLYKPGEVAMDRKLDYLQFSVSTTPPKWISGQWLYHLTTISPTYGDTDWMYESEIAPA